MNCKLAWDWDTGWTYFAYVGHHPALAAVSLCLLVVFVGLHWSALVFIDLRWSNDH